MDAKTIKQICLYYDEQEEENAAMVKDEEDRHQKMLANLKYSRRPNAGRNNEWAVAFTRAGIKKTPELVEEVSQYMRTKSFIEG